MWPLFTMTVVQLVGYAVTVAVEYTEAVSQVVKNVCVPEVATGLEHGTKVVLVTVWVIVVVVQKVEVTVSVCWPEVVLVVVGLLVVVRLVVVVVVPL